MEGREKPHMDKYKEIINDWNYDTSCMLTPLLVWDFENFKRFIFVAQFTNMVTVLTSEIMFANEMKNSLY
jgi:hypothetical protein